MGLHTLERTPRLKIQRTRQRQCMENITFVIYRLNFRQINEKNVLLSVFGTLSASFSSVKSIMLNLLKLFHSFIIVDLQDSGVTNCTKYTQICHIIYTYRAIYFAIGFLIVSSLYTFFCVLMTSLRTYIHVYIYVSSIENDCFLYIRCALG